MEIIENYWNIPAGEIASGLHIGLGGLTDEKDLVRLRERDTQEIDSHLLLRNFIFFYPNIKARWS